MSSDLTVRRVRFDWDRTPMHWVPEDPQTTHTLNVLHLLLPAGERWFGKVERQALPLVTDDRLRADLLAFVGQEAVHARAHQTVLDHLQANGLDPTPFTDRVDWLFDTALGDRPFGRRLPKRLEAVWLRRRLAIVAAIEHFTAVLGDWIVAESGSLEAAGADPTMLDLLRWHGAEEVEHRSVAFDVYEHVSGNLAVRIMTMCGTLPALLLVWVWGTRWLMANDPTLQAPHRRPSWRRYLRAARRGTLPRMRLLFGAVPTYLRPAFHPSQAGEVEAAVAYLQRSPAALAATASKIA